jgi:hypothetical protein
MQARYYDCGICGHYHPIDWNADCRDDANRFTAAQLDERHGANGWAETPWADIQASDMGWTETPDGRWWREPQDGENIPVLRLAYFLGSGPFIWADSAEDALACDDQIASLSA